MPNRLKVLIDTSPLSNANQLRGVGTYTRFLTQELEKIEEIKLERSTHKTSRSFKPDVIHYPYFDLYFSTLPLLRKAKTVVTIHDLIPLVFPDHYPVGKRGAVSWKVQQLALKSVDAVITDSQASQQDIVSLLHLPQEKVHVVYLAGNPNVKQVSKNQVGQIRKKYQLPQSYLLYVGDINYNKNLPQLIKAVKYLPNRVHLVLTGKNFHEQDIPEWQWLETQISLSDVRQRVHFVNDINLGEPETLSALYTGATCYVQPSLYEGFGLPVLEAMQTKTPVVAAQNSSLIEVGGKHVVFVKETAQEIAEGIKQVMAWSEEHRKEVVEEAYLWALSFTWQKTARETVRVYQQLG